MQRIKENAYNSLKSKLEMGEDIICQTCKGTGQINLNICSFGEPKSSSLTQMDCRVCHGLGKFKLCEEDGQERWFLSEIERNMWCKCTDQFIKSTYSGNNECAGCISKHHYHCNKCNLITQIG